MARRILHLSTVHPVDDLRIFRKEVRSLRQAGYDVTMAGVRSEPHPGDLEPAIIFEPVTARSRRFRASMARTIETCRKVRPDILHFHDPEILPALPFVRRYCGAIIYDSHEFLSEAVQHKEYLPAFLRPLIGFTVGMIERALLHFVDAIVVPTPHMANYFNRFGKPVIQAANYPVRTSLPEFYGAEGREEAAIYTGGLARVRGLIQMVEASAMSGIALHLAGSTDGEGQAFLAHGVPPQVDVHGYVSHTESLKLQAKARLGMSLLQPHKQYFNAIPTKVFEFLAAGLIVISSDFPFLRQLFADFRTIKFVDPQNVPQIADAMREGVAEYGASAEALRESRERVLQHFTWEAQAERLLQLYGQLLEKLPRAGERPAEDKACESGS
jgi:glycosyltransferase involved in cell wall biosynthesis